jgi:hypothetical protein
VSSYFVYLFCNSINYSQGMRGRGAAWLGLRRGVTSADARRGEVRGGELRGSRRGVARAEASRVEGRRLSKPSRGVATVKARAVARKVLSICEGRGEACVEASTEASRVPTRGEGRARLWNRRGESRGEDLGKARRALRRVVARAEVRRFEGRRES